MSNVINIIEQTFEASLEGWTLVNGSYPFSTDFGKGIGISYSIANYSGYSSASKRIASFDLSQLKFIGKYISMYLYLYYSFSPYTSGSGFGYGILYVRFADASGNIIVTHTIANLYVSSYAGSKSVKVLQTFPIPSNAKYVYVDTYLYVYSGTSSLSSWFDCVYIYDNEPYKIWSDPLFFNDAVRNYTVSINLSGNYMISFQRLDSLPSQLTSVTESLNYTDTSNTSKSTGLTTTRIDANSVVSLVVGGQNNNPASRQQALVRYSVTIYDRTNGKLVTVLFIMMSMMLSPQQPEVISVSVPIPANNYNFSNQGTLVLTPSDIPNPNASIKPSLSVSGDLANISNASITVEIYDSSGTTLIDSDTATIVNGTITNFTKTFIIAYGSYVIKVSGVITASVTTTTYINISFEYNTLV